MKRPGRLLYSCILGAAGFLAAERAAEACGAAYPGGPVMCDYPRGDHAKPAARPVIRLSSSYAYTNTTILFLGGDRRTDLTRHAAFVAGEVPLSRSASSSFALQFGAGGIGNGSLVSNATATNPSRIYDIGPGFSAFTGIAWRALDAKEWTPFIHLTATLSFSHAATRSAVSNDRYSAVDFRFGAIVGKTLGDSGITPYIAARLFGGPVFWRLDGQAVTGTDLYKYQLGGGLSVALFDRRIDLFAEGIGLGERGIAAGVGTTFF